VSKPSKGSKAQRRKRAPARRPAQEGDRPLKPPPLADEPADTPPAAPQRAICYAGLPGPWWHHALAIAGLLVLACVFYLPDVNTGFFHLDDPDYVSKNAMIQGLTASNVKRMLFEPYFANYSPMHLLSYAVDHAVGGLDPRVFHWSSNIWGGLVAGCVYLLAMCLFGRFSAALAAGLLFVAHPAHVEAIAWISSRKDLVAAVFATLSAVTYVQYRRYAGTRSAWCWYAASIVLFLLGVAGKQSVVVLPGILLGFDLFFEGRWDKGLVLDKIAYGGVGLVFALRVMGAQPPTGRSFDLYRVAFTTLHNLWLLTGCSEYVIYRLPPVAPSSALAKGLVIAAAGLLGVLPLALWFHGPRKVIAIAYWLLLAMAPAQVLGFIHPVVDRYLYFPSVALSLFAAFAVDRAAALGTRRGLTVVSAICACICIVWGAKSASYLNEWRDPRSVWYGAVRKSEDPLCYQFLASHYIDTADRVIAALPKRDPETLATADAFARAVWRDDPRLDALLAEWQDAGKGKVTDEFRRHLYEVARENLDAALARKGDENNPNLYFRRGMVLTYLGEHDAAWREFEIALAEAHEKVFAQARDQLIVLSHEALGIVAWRKRDYQIALEQMLKADEEQRKRGGNWAPRLPDHIQRLKRLTRQN